MIESIMVGEHEVGRVDQTTSGCWATSRVDNERQSFPDYGAAVAWLKRLWADYHKRGVTA